MPAVLTSYDELTAALAKLPRPPRGYARVYRGQNQDYGVMVPTMLRGEPDPRDFLWASYAGLLALDEAERAGDPERVGDHFDLFRFWVRVIKQHYGPGTEYLDVTRSLDIALWFALHAAIEERDRAAYGSPGPFDPERDIRAEHSFLRFEPYREQPAFLYVFDVPEADGPGLDTDRLIDLSRGPAAFADSPRIRAQDACLLRGDADKNNGDLASYYVEGTPLRVGWPMTGCPGVDRSPNQIFPPVDADSWYARFVALPLAPRLDASTSGALSYRHPVRISLYVPDDGSDEAAGTGRRDLERRVVCVPPPLVYADALDQVRGGGVAALVTAFENATKVLLDGPALALMRPLEVWNQGLLMTGWRGSAPTRRLGEEHWSGDADLRSVFIELSLLERTGWERVERAGGAMQVTRAVWIVRSGDELGLTAFRQTIPGGEITAEGPWKAVYDPRLRKLAVVLPGGRRAPVDCVEDPGVPLVKGLGLIRHLSPVNKVAHFPAYDIGKTWSVPVQWALAELVSLEDLPAPLDRYHVARLIGSDKPFLGGDALLSPATAGKLVIEGDRAFAAMDPEKLLRSAEELLAYPPPAPWRAREPR